MKPSLRIHIPEPCHEDWSKMTATEKGKFCNSCEKEVIDFTALNNEQLLKRINQGSNLCGRFRPQQLDTPLALERKERNSWLSALTGFIMPLALLFSNETKAQKEAPKTEQQTPTDTRTYTALELGTNHRDSIKKKSTISGIIRDNDGLPLPGANITIKGTQTGTNTNFDGYFEIEAKTGQTLDISFIGFESKTVLIKPKDESLDITLMAAIAGGIEIMLGMVAVTEDYIPNPCDADCQEEREETKRKKEFAKENRINFLIKKKAERRAEREHRKQEKAKTGNK